MRSHRTALVLLTACLAASQVRAQDPKGTELRINLKPGGTQGAPDVAVGANGRFVVVWKDGVTNDTSREPVYVMARLFDVTGQPRSGEFRVAAVTAQAFSAPAVAMAPDGRFVVVWQGGTEDPSLAFGRRFAADGHPLGARFRLSSQTGQDAPDVAMSTDGSFVAAWTQAVEGTAEVNTDVFYRRFGPEGRPLGPEALALGGFEEQSAPRVALRSNGDFVIVGQSYEGEGRFYDVVARRFASTGEPAGDGIVVTDAELNQTEPAVAMAADGRFAVTWTDQGADSQRGPTLTNLDDARGVAIRVFGADGLALGASRFVNLYLPGAQEHPAISALQHGGFLVVWASGAAQDGDGSGIFARIHTANGTPRDKEFRINLNRTGSQNVPSLAIVPNGKGATVWAGPDGDNTGVFARRIGLPGRGF